MIWTAWDNPAIQAHLRQGGELYRSGERVGGGPREKAVTTYGVMRYRLGATGRIEVFNSAKPGGEGRWIASAFSTRRDLNNPHSYYWAIAGTTEKQHIVKTFRPLRELAARES